jgi:hypothetical protein
MDERTRDPYDHQALLQTVGSLAVEHKLPNIYRRKSPRYHAFFTARDTGMKYIKIEFGSALPDQDMRIPFALADALAERLEPVYGQVHPIWKLGNLSQAYSASGIFKAVDFQRCGPRSLCSRTWLGAHLTRLIGRDLLVASGCFVKDTPWRGLQVDLVERPEEATFDILHVRQAEVMKELQRTGAFGDYSISFQCKPGSRWTPVPTEKSR